MEKFQELRWATAWVIKEVRESAGLSQRQMAELAGLSGSYTPRVEQATADVTLVNLALIAAVLKTDLWEILRRIEEEMRHGPRKPDARPGRPRKLTKTPRRRGVR